MDINLFKEQALCARDLAEQADPFTRKRLLVLADRYDAKAAGPSRASRALEQPVPLSLRWPAPASEQSGEA